MPSELRKKPDAHFAHAVPLSAVVHPVRHVHVPSDPHEPFSQLHVDGRFLIAGWRHLPVPVIPSSQDSQSAGHAWHVGPKKPFVQVSQEVPLNPVGQTQVPDAEHTPAPAHGGEHADD